MWYACVHVTNQARRAQTLSLRHPPPAARHKRLDNDGLGLAACRRVCRWSDDRRHCDRTVRAGARHRHRRAARQLCAEPCSHTEIVNSVRVTVLESSVPELNATWASDEVILDLFAAASDIWSAAAGACAHVACPPPPAHLPDGALATRPASGIRWNVSDIVRGVQSERDEAFVRQVLKADQPPAILLANRTVYPVDGEHFSNTSGTFNVVLISSLGSYGTGVYNHNTLGLLHALRPEKEPKGFTPAGMLAHNLAHMVGVVNCNCYQHHANLMRTHCGFFDGDNLADPVTLDACQVATARELSAARVPWDRLSRGSCPCDGCGWSRNVVVIFSVGAVASVALVALTLLVYFIRRRRHRVEKERRSAMLQEEDDVSDDEEVAGDEETAAAAEGAGVRRRGAGGDRPKKLKSGDSKKPARAGSSARVIAAEKGKHD